MTAVSHEYLTLCIIPIEELMKVILMKMSNGSIKKIVTARVCKLLCKMLLRIPRKMQ